MRRRFSITSREFLWFVALPSVGMLVLVGIVVARSLPYHQGRFASSWFREGDFQVVVTRFREMGAPGRRFLERQLGGDPARCARAAEVLGSIYQGTGTEVAGLRDALMEGEASQQCSAFFAMRRIGMASDWKRLGPVALGNAALLSAILSTEAETGATDVPLDVVRSLAGSATGPVGVRLAAVEALNTRKEAMDCRLFDALAGANAPSIRIAALDYLLRGVSSWNEVPCLDSVRSTLGQMLASPEADIAAAALATIAANPETCRVFWPQLYEVLRSGGASSALASLAVVEHYRAYETLILDALGTIQESDRWPMEIRLNADRLLSDARAHPAFKPRPTGPLDPSWN